MKLNMQFFNDEALEPKAVPLFSKTILTILIVTALLCFGSLAHAQADRGGLGGDWTEADLKHFLNRLTPYLSSEEGKSVFPEIESYNLAHPNETVQDIADHLNPRLTDKPVFDGDHNERDCVSYITPVRYFECNLKHLPPKPTEDASDSKKSEYYGSLYRLVLHEVLVQAGLERPLSVEVPSSYGISSRLMVHLENFPEWVPGESKFSPGEKYNGPGQSHVQWGIGVASAALGDLSANGPLLGLNLKLQIPVIVNDEEFKFGFSATYAHSVSGVFGHVSQSYLPDWTANFLLTAEYEFKTHSSFKPYIGIGFGLTLDPVQFTGYDYPDYQPYTQNYNSLNGLITITPGVNFGNKQQYFFEVPVLIGTGAIKITPTLGMHF